MGLQRVGHDWVTELNWTDSDLCEVIPHSSFDLTTHLFISKLTHQWRPVGPQICCLYIWPCILLVVVVIVVQSLSCIWLFVIPWTGAQQASLSFTIFQSLPKFMSTDSVMPCNHHILCCLLLLLPSIVPSIRVLFDELALHIRRPKHWSFSIGPSSDSSGLISFRIDWFDLLAVWGTLKSLFQDQSSKASILQCSALFLVQLHICALLEKA